MANRKDPQGSKQCIGEEANPGEGQMHIVRQEARTSSIGDVVVQWPEFMEEIISLSQLSLQLINQIISLFQLSLQLIS